MKKSCNNKSSQIASPPHQTNIYYNGKPQYETNVKRGSLASCLTLSPERQVKQNNAIVYPTTHSIPGPYLQSYIRSPNKMYMY